MKNTIFAVALVSAIIIITVLTMSFFRENPDVSFKKDENVYYQAPTPQFDFELQIVTSEANFWDRYAALKATEAPEEEGTGEDAVFTDENGNPVTMIPDTAEDGAEVTAVPEETEEEVTTKILQGFRKSSR